MPGGPKHAARAGSVGTSAWWDAHSGEQELSTGPSGTAGTRRLLGSLHGLNTKQPPGWQLSTASRAAPVPWERRGSEDRR